MMIINVVKVNEIKVLFHLKSTVRNGSQVFLWLCQPPRPRCPLAIVCWKASKQVAIRFALLFTFLCLLYLFQLWHFSVENAAWWREPASCPSRLRSENSHFHLCLCQCSNSSHRVPFHSLWNFTIARKNCNFGKKCPFVTLLLFSP